MDDYTFDDLSEDPELAFVFLERQFRAEAEQSIAEYRNNDSDSTEVQLRYMSQTLAARSELSLDILTEWTLPPARDMDYNIYTDFKRDVDHFRTAIRIRNTRRIRGYSVLLDVTAKRKIRHHLQQVREIVETLELEQWKRESLFEKINAVDADLDKERSSLAKYGALVAEASGIFGDAVGEMAVKAEPARKFLETIGFLIWGAEMQERSKQLPSPEKPKQIEPPKKTKPMGRRSLPDDEIPF